MKCDQVHLKNLLLALKADVFWPFDETGKVTARLNILADAKVAWALFDERILSPSKKGFVYGRNHIPWGLSWS
jgi:hypothetical protein